MSQSNAFVVVLQLHIVITAAFPSIIASAFIDLDPSIATVVQPLLAFASVIVVAFLAHS